MSLVPDYSSSSNDGTTSEEDIAPPRKQVKEDGKLKLPSANLLLSSGKPGEVFNNPYKEAETAKIAVLEKHVKMSESEEHVREKNGKKICWNYRKGRCRFGSNCTFAHDSDLQMNAGSDKIDDEKNSSTNSKISNPQHGLQNSTNTIIDSSTDSKSIKKRNRPGLGDNIVPSKKVVKSYQNQQKMKFS